MGELVEKLSQFTESWMWKGEEVPEDLTNNLSRKPQDFEPTPLGIDIVEFKELK